MGKVENIDFSIEESDWARKQIEKAAAKTGNSDKELEKLSKTFLDTIKNRRTRLQEHDQEITATRRSFLRWGLVTTAGIAASYVGWTSENKINAGIEEAVESQYPKQPNESIESAKKMVTDYEAAARQSGREGNLEEVPKSQNSQIIREAYKITDQETSRIQLQEKLAGGQSINNLLSNTATAWGYVAIFFGGCLAVVDGSFNVTHRLSRRKLLLPLSGKTK